MHTKSLFLFRRSLMAALALSGLLVLGVNAASARPAAAHGGEVTRGDLQTFSAGLTRGYSIAGHAVMVRTGSGQTLVSVHATGLAPNTTYPVHVHNLPCGVSSAGGHYQHIVGGAVDAINEIWPGYPAFTTNPAGIGNGDAVHAFRARPEAQSIVIHDTDGARIACADLLP